MEQKLEAYLFFRGEEVSIKELAKALQISEEEVDKGLEELHWKLMERKSGLSLQRQDSSSFEAAVRRTKIVALTTAPETADWMAEFLREETKGELTPTQIEIMTIIAYNQPITLSAIEIIRGVASAQSVRTLLRRGLIEILLSGEKSDLYQLTSAALRQLGISNVSALPKYEEYKKLATKITLQNEE